jgi:hypothetical protein
MSTSPISAENLILGQNDHNLSTNALYFDQKCNSDLAKLRISSIIQSFLERVWRVWFLKLLISKVDQRYVLVQ